jgi:hypothetical protein
VTKSKDRRERKADQLGMAMGTAEKHLRKEIIHELASQLGKDLCCRCNLKIDSPDDFSIVHVQDWEENSDLFWDLTNIAFSHTACEAARSGKRQRERKPMSKVEVRVEDPNGKPLPGARHNGELYVAGKMNGRYHIRVRNKTNRRVLIVTTVDGRSVHTGEPGGDDESGHVLGPRESWVFKGWRTSDSEVAAFRFGKKGNSYSSQLGSPENVGVIGVAVFEEEEPEPIIRTVKEYVPYPVPTPFIQPYPYTSPGIFWTTQQVPNTGGSITLTSTSDVSMDGIASVNCSTSMGGGRIGSSASQFSITNDSAPVAKARGRKRGRQEVRAKQDLGTEFGEQVHSSVVSVEFERATDAPCEVWTIYYDSMYALKQKGIMVGRPSQKPQSPPQAFPQQPEWEDGYCKPPARRRAYKP